MKITPLDIRRKEFKRSVRGYSDEEVDIFLDEVADEFERLFQENMELHDRMSRMDEQIAGHAQLKDALEKTLISAQLQAEELRANAHKESELILRDAEMKARGIVSDSYGETQKTQHTLVQLKLLEEDFRFKFRSLLEGYIRLLDQAPRASAGSESEPLPQIPDAPKAAAVAGSATGHAQVSSAGETLVAPQAKPAPTAPPITAPVSTPVAAPTPVAATVTPAAATAPVAPVPVARPVVPAPFGETASRAVPAQPSAAPTVPAMPPTQPATPPAAPAQPHVPPAPPYRPAPAFTPIEQPPVAGPPVERPSEFARPVAPPLDDDQPTHESTLGPNGAETEQFRWPQPPPEGDVTQEAETAESALTQEATMSDRTVDEPLRRFFFGRQLNDVDDTFQPDDAAKKESNREFEW